MPALSKAPEDRERRNAPLELVRGALGLPEPPPRPPGLSLKLRRQWDSLWLSTIAQLLDPAVDGPIIARLFELYALGEQIARMLAAGARAEREIQRRIREIRKTGATDSAYLDIEIVELEAARRTFNSTVGARVRVATEVRMLEAQLGLSPRSRLALGVMLLAGRKAIAQATADADDDDDY